MEQVMPAPICVKCQVEMRCEKNEQLVNDVTAGQSPASYWSGDLFECRACDAAVVVVGVVSLGMLSEGRVMRDRKLGESITFAYSPEQREQYADQFETRSEPVDERG